MVSCNPEPPTKALKNRWPICSNWSLQSCCHWRSTGGRDWLHSAVNGGVDAISSQTSGYSWSLQCQMVYSQWMWLIYSLLTSNVRSVPFWQGIPKAEFFLGSTVFAVSHNQALASSLVFEAWEVWQPYTEVKAQVMAALLEDVWGWVPLSGWHWGYRGSWRFHGALQGLFCNPRVLSFSKSHLNVPGWVIAVTIIVAQFTYTINAPNAL